MRKKITKKKCAFVCDRLRITAVSVPSPPKFCVPDGNRRKQRRTRVVFGTVVDSSSIRIPSGTARSIFRSFHRRGGRPFSERSRRVFRRSLSPQRNDGENECVSTLRRRRRVEMDASSFAQKLHTISVRDIITSDDRHSLPPLFASTLAGYSDDDKSLHKNAIDPVRMVIAIASLAAVRDRTNVEHTCRSLSYDQTLEPRKRNSRLRSTIGLMFLRPFEFNDQTSR